MVNWLNRPDISNRLASTSDGLTVKKLHEWVDDIDGALGPGDVGTLATQDADSVTVTGGSITGITDIAVADGGTGASDAPTAKTNLGLGNVDNTSDADKPISTATQTALDLKADTADLGTIATQSAGSVAITGGSITGITDIAIADGGTGASDAETAIAKLTHKARAEFKVDTSGLTTIGDMTAGGGLAAINDGDTDEAHGDCATAGSTTSSFAGYVLPSPIVVAGVRVYGSNNFGLFIAETGGTVNLRGKLGSNPATDSDGDLIGTLEWDSDASDESAGRAIESTEKVKTYDRVWIEAITASADVARLAELELWEHKSVGNVRSAADRAGMMLSARDYGASRHKLDNATALTNLLTDAGEAGCHTVIPNDMGTLELGSQVEADIVKPFTWLAGRGGTKFYWPSTVSTSGLLLNCGADVNGINWSGGEFITGRDCLGDALYFDWSAQISPDNIETANYGTTPPALFRMVLEKVRIAGATDVTTDSWKNGIIVNAAKRVTIRDCDFIGRRNGTDFFEHEDVRRAISFIGKDSVERVITDVSVGATVTVTYTGTDPANDALYYVEKTGMRLIDEQVWACANVNAGSNTFELADANTTGESAYDTGTDPGRFYGCPQVNNHEVYNCKGIWWNTAIYDGHTEGLRTFGNNFTGGSKGIHKQNQQVLESTSDYFDVGTAGIWASSGNRIEVRGLGLNMEAKATHEAGTKTRGVYCVNCNDIMIDGFNASNVDAADLAPITLTRCERGILSNLHFNYATAEAILLDGSTTDIDIAADTCYARSGGAASTAPKRLVLDSSTGTNRVHRKGGLEFRKEITLLTSGAITNTGLTPSGQILSASIIVTEAITGLDSADHHIQLGIAGTADKYCDVANGSAATSIAKNKKGHYIDAPVYEASQLRLTITGGADTTPTGGKVDVCVVYRPLEDLPDVA